MIPAGYSSTPLAKKLGIKAGFIIRLINPPANYYSLFTDMPANVNVVEEHDSKKDFIHCFTKVAAELGQLIPLLKSEIVQNGTIWISWPKKASKVATDITEDLIREMALANGLVDVKVCAVDEIWSGLKLVILVKDRVK